MAIPSVETRATIVANLQSATWENITDAWEDITDTWQSVSTEGTAFELITVGQMPQTPDSCITIYDTGGFGNLGGVGESSIQVRVRNNDYQVGYNATQSIKEHLESLHNYNSTIVFWESIGDIEFLKRDDNQRWIFTLNMRVAKNQI